MASVSTRLLLLGMMSLPAGCLSTPQTRIEGTEAAIVAQVCRAWVPITYSSKDTAATVLEVRAGNAARDAYCKG